MLAPCNAPAGRSARAPHKALLLAIAPALALVAGCSHDHDRERAAAPPRAALLKEAEAAADAIVSSTRLYLEARERNPAAAPAKTDIAAKDAALDALFEAGKAESACDLSEHLADDVDLDPGRAGRLKSSAGLVRRAVAVVVKQAGEVARSGQGERTLKTDLDHLRAALRALKVDLYTLQAQVQHDD